jgi:hypothetical protein
MDKENDLTTEERLEAITYPENQGGDLSTRDYVWYVLLGVVFPVAILIWGWY